MAVPAGIWAVTYGPERAAGADEAAAESAPSFEAIEAPAPLHLPKAKGLDDAAPLSLPIATGLDDRVEALALAMWNDGRKAEAVEFLERQIALTKETTDPVAQASALPEDRPLPAASVPAVVAAHQAAGPRRRPSARILGIGVAAVLLLAIGADFLIGSEDEPDVSVGLLAVDSTLAPEPASVSDPPDQRRPEAVAEASVPGSQSDRVDTAESSVAAAELGPDVTGSIPTPAAADPDNPSDAVPSRAESVDVASAAAQPDLADAGAFGLPAAVEASEPGFDALFSGDALHAAPLQTATIAALPGLANLPSPQSPANAAAVEAEAGGESTVIAVAEESAAPGASATTAAADTGARTTPVEPPLSDESAPPPELVEGSPPPESGEEGVPPPEFAEETTASPLHFVEEAIPPPETVDADGSAEVIYEDEAMAAESTVAAEAEQSPIAIPEPRLPKARPDVAVALAPVEPAAATAVIDPHRPVLLGRPSGHVSARLAERRAVAERIAARRRAVAEWHAARRARIVLLGRPYWQ